MPEIDLPTNETEVTDASGDAAAPASSEPASAQASNSPVVVSEAEVAAVTDTERLSEQIEILSGEIQALEAKIERLMNSSDSSGPESSNQPAGSLRQEADSKTAEATVVKGPTVPPVPPSPGRVQATATPVNDIYAKHLGSAAASTAKDDVGSAELDEGGSVIGTIGEMLIIFGAVIFFAMLASPLVKGVLSADVFDAVKAVGWPTVTISLFLGFIISLFTKGKTGAKIMSIVFLLVSAVMVVGVLGFDSALGPLQPLIAPIFEFYR